MPSKSIQEILEVQSAFLRYVSEYKDISLPEFYLTGAYKNCYSVLKEYYLKNNELPNLPTLLELVKEKGLDERVYSVYAECSLAPEYNKGYLETTLEEDYNLRSFQNAVREFNDGIQKGESPKLLKDKALSLLLKESNDVNIPRGYVWEDAPQRWKKFKEQAASNRKLLGVPTHINCFDINFSGMVRGRSYLAVALPKTGKTIFKLNVGYNVARYEKEHVLFITGEMTKESLQIRIDARDSMIDSLLIANANLADSLKERYRLALAAQYDRKDPLYIEEPKPGFTPVDVASYVMKYEREFGVMPYLVIVDYLWKMKSHRRVTGGRPEELGIIMEDLEEMVCKKFNVALLISTQESRSGALLKKHGKERGQESVGLSGQVSPHVDAQFLLDTYHNTADLSLMNKLFVDCDTNRFGPTFKSELIYLKEFSYIGDSEIIIT